MVDNKELIRKMLEYRARHNMSQQELAKLCNITPQSVSNIERGYQDPTTVTKTKILLVVDKQED